MEKTTIKKFEETTIEEYKPKTHKPTEFEVLVRKNKQLKNHVSEKEQKM